MEEILREAHDSPAGRHFEFKRVQMNVLDPFPKSSRRNRLLLIIVNCFNKWVEAFPQTYFRVKTVAKIFVEQVVSKHEVSLKLHTNQGNNFESKLFKDIIDLLGIQKTRIAALYRSVPLYLLAYRIIGKYINH
ncbi:hypothetical protein HZH66_014644 [Vespula vulgaris]|uniref:Integrase catalytic domain-containing protein n=1 Tax=Vespula vulgaris TaxID=7454 RepID=A0A834J1U8_VESVU|nr:hypothetical protein HZH66_014644 [Vespula vulgaris]